MRHPNGECLVLCVCVCVRLLSLVTNVLFAAQQIIAGVCVCVSDSPAKSPVCCSLLYG